MLPWLLAYSHLPARPSGFPLHPVCATDSCCMRCNYQQHWRPGHCSDHNLLGCIQSFHKYGLCSSHVEATDPDPSSGRGVAVLCPVLGGTFAASLLSSTVLCHLCAVFLLMACGGCGPAEHQLPPLWCIKGTPFLHVLCCSVGPLNQAVLNSQQQLFNARSPPYIA